MTPHIASALPTLLLAAALACGGGSSAPQTQPEEHVRVKLSGIGDSIMQGVDAAALGESPEESFAQGTDASVRSIFSRYRDRGDLPAGEEFVSVSGAEMVNDALGQAQRICAQAVKPDRVVVLLGGNDVCNRGSVDGLYPVETFQQAVQSALDALGGAACGLPAGSWVHVLSMPRVDQLRAAGLQMDQAANDTHCQQLWSAFSICSVVTRETSQSTLDAIGARIDQYNEAMAAAVAAADLAHGGAAGVHFTTDWQGPLPGHPDTSVGTVLYGAGDVSSVDCFHPSVAGQRRLACLAWESWEFPGPGVAGCAP